MASSYGEDASKSALRSGYDLLCSRLTPRHEKQVQREIFLHLEALPAFRNATAVLAYLPFRDEVDLRPLIERLWKKGRPVALPRRTAHGCSVEFCLVRSWNDLERVGGCLEPRASLTALEKDELELSICLVPGLVFDACGYRIDYGAGFFDNFLAMYPGLKVGVVRSVQVSGNPLPIEDHDEPVDVLVSDGAVWNCRRTCH